MLEKIDLSKKVDKKTYRRVMDEAEEKLGLLQRECKDAGIPVKIRACDTMGYGVPYSGAALPRSVAGIIYGQDGDNGIPVCWSHALSRIDYIEELCTACDGMMR